MSYVGLPSGLSFAGAPVSPAAGVPKPSEEPSEEPKPPVLPKPSRAP